MKIMTDTQLNAMRVRTRVRTLTHSIDMLVDQLGDVIDSGTDVLGTKRGELIELVSRVQRNLYMVRSNVDDACKPHLGPEVPA